MSASVNWTVDTDCPGFSLTRTFGQRFVGTWPVYPDWYARTFVNGFRERGRGKGGGEGAREGLDYVAKMAASSGNRKI